MFRKRGSSVVARNKRRRGRGRSPNEFWQNVGIVGLGAFVVGVLILGIFLWFRTERVERDVETNCPVAGPTGLTAIYVDTTDRVDSVSRADVLGRLEAIVEDTSPDEMVAAFRSAPIRSGANTPIAPLLERCHPGDPEAASRLTQNPRLIRRRLASEFRAPLEDVFRETLDSSTSDSSPLMENLQAISVTLLSRHHYVGLPKRLIFVSDLLQHSGNLSLYGGVPDYSTFVQTPGSAAVSSDFRDVSVSILFVQRDEHERLGGSQVLREFWRLWIEDQGGMLDRFTPISGLNPS